MAKLEEENVNRNLSPKKPRVFTWQAVFSLLMFVFMYLPILVLTFYSFNQSPYSATWQGFTLEWYRKLFSDEWILSAFPQLFQNS
jgi:spermidine/putrescine transport system permease protein